MLRSFAPLMLSAVLACTASLTPAGSAAQTYPSKPITVIVPYAAGGNVDAVARWVAPELGRRLGQTIVIENVAGAGGVIGTDRASRATPDGHTLLFSVESTIVIARMVSPSVVKYDGLKDFAPVTLVSSAPLVLVGRPGLPAQSLADLIRVLREQPGKLNYATSGIGTSLHVAGEMFNQIARVSMVHVPYKVGAQIVSDLMGNQIDLAMLPIPLAGEQIKAGKVRGFAVTSPERSPSLPNVPSTAEHPDTRGVDVTVWFGFFAPARTDGAIIARLHRELDVVLRDQGLRDKFAVMGMRTLALGPAEFGAFLQGEDRKFGEIVRARNIRVE